MGRRNPPLAAQKLVGHQAQRWSRETQMPPLAAYIALESFASSCMCFDKSEKEAQTAIKEKFGLHSLAQYLFQSPYS